MKAKMGILCTVLLACGLSEEDFTLELCAMYTSYEEGPCGALASQRMKSCETLGLSDGHPCIFQKDIAEACLNGLWMCDGESGDIKTPFACADVYVCEDDTDGNDSQ